MAPPDKLAFMVEVLETWCQTRAWLVNVFELTVGVSLAVCGLTQSPAEGDLARECSACVGGAGSCDMQVHPVVLGRGLLTAGRWQAWGSGSMHSDHLGISYPS